MAKKTPRPRARTPKGFRDYFGAEVTRRKAMLDAIAEIYHRYGFDALETSAVETVEALGKFLPDVDRPNEGVFAWQEDDTGSGADWLALRYDLTAPLARVAAQYRNELPTPYRRYSMGPVWRNEKPGPGRFRQFYQCDADTVGAASVAADAEMCMMLADTLEAVGIERGNYLIRINSRKVLNGVMEVAGLSGEDKADERGIVLRAIDKLDRLGISGIRALLGEGRRDDSGDVTKGAELSEEQTERIISFVAVNHVVRAELSEQSSTVPEEKVDVGAVVGMQAEATVIRGRPDPFARIGFKPAAMWNETVARHLLRLIDGSATGLEGVNEVKEIAALLESQGYGPDRIVIDPSVVRGLGYYTGPVFEAELTFETLDEKGQPRAFGSVAGGGRYDDLVKRFTGQEVPATGVSIGVDRLLAALSEQSRQTEERGPVVVTVMDRDRMADYFALASKLRAAGIRAEVYLGNPKNFGNQLKYADKRAAPFAIIEGEDERARGVVQIKDLDLGARLAETASHDEWKDQPAQFECPRADLVEQIRRRLNGR